MRERLLDHVGPDVILSSTSVIQADALPPNERRAAQERWWEDRIRNESGPVVTTFDPNQFEWVRPDYLRTDATSIIRIETKEIAVSIGRNDEGAMALLGQRVEVGFARAAIAIRLATSAKGYKMTRVFREGRRGAIRSTKLLQEAHRRGFGPKTVLEARWDPRTKMLVGILPK
ncbi:MAG TPA: hypothetical protein VIK75_04335, partial [Calditerricola sp.]